MWYAIRGLCNLQMKPCHLSLINANVSLKGGRREEETATTNSKNGRCRGPEERLTHCSAKRLRTLPIPPCRKRKTRRFSHLLGIDYLWFINEISARTWEREGNSEIWNFLGLLSDWLTKANSEYALHSLRTSNNLYDDATCINILVTHTAGNKAQPFFMLSYSLTPLWKASCCRAS